MGTKPPDTPAELTGQTFETMLPEFLGRRYWCTSTPLYRRRLCDKAGPWSDLPFWEDIEYDLRLATHMPRLCHCKDWLTEMRDHDFGRLSGSRFLNHPDLLSRAIRGAVLTYQHIRRAGISNDNQHVRSFIDDVRLMYNRCVDFGLDQQAQSPAEQKRPMRLVPATRDPMSGRFVLYLGQVHRPCQKGPRGVLIK